MYSKIKKIIFKQIIEFQTPCTLELGGKSPVYIDANCNIDVAVKRILWGKMVNLGQTVREHFLFPFLIIVL
jgi:aldehyde dehydrogenase (NAD+)